MALAITVTLVWLTGYLLAYATGGEAPQELTGLMVIVLGGAFAGEVKAAVKRRLESDDAPDD
jgi:ethanolamine utilization microcompartment shell protein EutL